MKAERKIYSLRVNTILNVVATASTAVMTVLTVPYLSRVLSVEGNGAVSYTQSVAGWFLTFCVPGISLYGVRECARVRDDSRKLATLVCELLIIISCCTCVSSLVFAMAILGIPAFRQVSGLMWIFLIGNVLSAYGVEWFYQSIEQYAYITIRTIVFKLLSIICVFCLVKTEDDYFLYGFLIAILSACNNLFNIARLAKLVDFKYVEKIRIAKHIKPLSFFFVAGLSTTVITSLDTVLLGLFTTGTYQVGLYQFSMKCKNLFSAVINAVTNAMVPRVSYEESQGHTQRRLDIWHKGFVLIVFFSLSLSVYVFIFADPIINFTVTAKFSEAATPLRLLCPLMVLMALNTYMSSMMLIPMKRESVTTTVNAIGAIISVSLGCVFDHRYGANGAASAVLIANIVIFLCLLHSTRTYWQSIGIGKNLLKLVLSTIIAGLCSVIGLVLSVHMGSFGILLESSMSFWLVLLVSACMFKEECAITILRMAQATIGKMIRCIHT